MTATLNRSPFLAGQKVRSVTFGPAPGMEYHARVQKTITKPFGQSSRRACRDARSAHTGRRHLQVRIYPKLLWDERGTRTVGLLRNTQPPEGEPGAGERCLWWRRGRVELPVQKGFCGTSTSVAGT